MEDRLSSSRTLGEHAGISKTKLPWHIAK
ncbi:hypothetical protein CCACVL1_24966 [Corchorus capsularis]|uniref:Uncharacterized protein n=1 Tax=Corchorus capsularis TaxID=210143 RepID=A0A1R3GMG2_COCAP|nr:hypothetical protein CCACVL1_24966 [Corchorus capsularis]